VKPLNLTGFTLEKRHKRQRWMDDEILRCAQNDRYRWGNKWAKPKVIRGGRVGKDISEGSGG